MEPKISVIVPVYKVEKYLPRCVDSILSQSFTDFELILVDDGSPDNCGKICDEYAQKDSRVRVFHKSNGGVSSARNLGLDNAKGEWITFIDSDDYIHEMFLSTLYKKHNVDLIVGSFQVIGYDEGWNGILEDSIYDEFSLKDNIVKISLMINLQTPWGKLFRHDIICTNHIVFDEKLHIGEDTLFVLNYLAYTSRLWLCDKPYYFYERGNVNCLSRSKLDIEHHIYSLEAFDSTCRKLEEVFGCQIKHVYLSHVKFFSKRYLNYLYHSNGSLFEKVKNLRFLRENKHMMFLFCDKMTVRGKRIRLFHFLMRHNFCFVSLLYLYLLKGKIYF